MHSELRIKPDFVQEPQTGSENAGGKWVDEQVHRCNTGDWVLITSRNPDDIPAFNDAILKELEGDVA